MINELPHLDLHYSPPQLSLNSTYNMAWQNHCFEILWTKIFVITLKCLSIGTPKTNNFPFVSNEKLMIFMCPNIQAHDNYAVIYLNFGTPKNDEFSIWNKWKIYYF